MKTKEEIIKEIPEGYHPGCGSYGSRVVKDEDGAVWELCAKCGEALREVDMMGQAERMMARNYQL